MLVQSILLCLAVAGSTPITFASPLVLSNEEIVPRNVFPAFLPIEAHTIIEERDLQTKQGDDKDKDDNDCNDDDKNKGNGGKYGGSYSGSYGGKGENGEEGGKHYRRENNADATNTASLTKMRALLT